MAQRQMNFEKATVFKIIGLFSLGTLKRTVGCRYAAGVPPQVHPQMHPQQTLAGPGGGLIVVQAGFYWNLFYFCLV